MNSCLNFKQAWRISKIPYYELLFRSFVRSRVTAKLFEYKTSTGKAGYNSILRKVSRTAFGNKIAIAIIVSAASSIPLMQTELNHNMTVLSGVTLGLFIILGYTLLYEIQILPNLIDEQPAELLRLLPLTEIEITYIMTLALIRTIDFLAIASVAAPTLLLLLFTHSLSASLAVALGAIASIAFGTGLAIIFSVAFYGILNSGNGKRSNATARIALTIIWGAIVMTMGLLPNYTPYLAQIFDNFLKDAGTATTLILFALPPFTFSFLISSILNNNFNITFYISVIFSAIYLTFSLIIFRLGFRKLYNSSLKQPIFRGDLKDLEIIPRSQLFAYCIKDLKIAIKSPTTAFLLAAPLLETLLILFPLLNSNVSKAIMILVGTLVGGTFCSFVTLGLLAAEAYGTEYTQTLPISKSTVMYSKMLTSSLCYFPVPITFMLINIMYQGLLNQTILIPFLETPAIAASALALMLVVLATSGEEKTLSLTPSSNMFHFSVAFFASCLVLFVPIGAYITSVKITGDYGMSLLILIISATLEFAVMKKLSQIISKRR